MAKPSRTKQVVYWVLFLVVSCIAVYRLVFGAGGPIDDLPDTPESAQAFICRDCGHVFSVTPRQRAELMSEGGRVVREEMTAVRRMKLPCPACKAVEAVVARTCPHCGTQFLQTDKNGQRHVKCPDCEAQRSQ
jgi:Fe2+ or Zn2+ uptake regulation protein